MSLVDWGISTLNARTAWDQMANGRAPQNVLFNSGDPTATSHSTIRNVGTFWFCRLAIHESYRQAGVGYVSRRHGDSVPTSPISSKPRIEVQVSKQVYELDSIDVPRSVESKWEAVWLGSTVL